MKVLAASLGIVGAVVGLLVAVCLIDGFVLATLWRWFVPRILPGAPMLSIPVAIGLTLMIALLTHQDTSDLKKKDDTEWYSSIVGMFSRPLFTLLMAWIVLQFIER